MSLLRNAWGHFCTITYHRWLVCKSCFHIGLYWQGLTHDLSKYAPTEFHAGILHYTGTRSPNDLQRRANGYSAAWLHHKGRNKHHFEYWTDYTLDRNMEHPIQPVPMPRRYVAEMFCDRVAASKVYYKDAYTNRDPLQYYEKGRAKVIMHPQTDAMLHKMLTVLAEDGEEAAYKYIREEILGMKDRPKRADRCPLKGCLQAAGRRKAGGIRRRGAARSRRADQTGKNRCPGKVLCGTGQGRRRTGS